jgi:hypothetical protein
MSRVIFANKPFNSHPYFTPEQCKEVVIAALLSDQIKPENIIVGITDKGFKAFDRSKVSFTQPSSSFPRTKESFDLLDGRAFLTVEYNVDFSVVEIIKGSNLKEGGGFQLGDGRLRFNDKVAIDLLVDLYRTNVVSI